jgi:hypothetical protein
VSRDRESMCEGRACACCQLDATYQQFDPRDVGADATEGRYANVDRNRCRDCGQLWLRYFVKYEAFGRSGRWARCPISEDEARTIKPETAAAFIDRAPGYIFGGSYFGQAQWGSGPRHW